MNPYQIKLEMILDWATEHERFDASFVEDIYSKVERGAELTQGQMEAVDRIIERFGIGG